MPRATQRVPSRNRRKKIIAAASGYFGRKKNVFKLAKMAVDRAHQYAYRDCHRYAIHTHPGARHRYAHR